MVATRTLPGPKVLATALMLFGLCAGMVPADDAVVRINPDLRHQTILCFSAMPWYLGISPDVQDQVLDEVVQELGLTWVHWTVPSGNRTGVRCWEWSNDDGDPLHINWPEFGRESVDRSIKTCVLPFKQRVEARGDRFGLAITQTFHNRGSTGRVPRWLVEDPAEFAEYAVALLLHLKQTHGIEADYYVICKDAGTPGDNPFNVEVVTEMPKAVGPRLRAAGLRTTILFPECHDANTSWEFIQAGKGDAEFWPFVGMIGYHVYGDEAHNSERDKIRRFAVAKGLPTGHAGSDHSNIDTLYDDLTVGGVSYWSIGALGGPGAGGKNYHFHLDGTSFSRGEQFWLYRQIMHYVPPGAIRVDANSDTPAIRPLAFSVKGKTVAVLYGGAPPAESCSVTIRGLQPGDYGLSQSVETSPYEELGLKRVEADGCLRVAVPAGAVVTVYPHPDENLPPTVTTWKAQPSFLKTPADQFVLSAAAQDPELDRISYAWKILRQPDPSQSEAGRFSCGNHLGNRPDIARAIRISSGDRRRSQSGCAQCSRERLRRQSASGARGRPQSPACEGRLAAGHLRAAWLRSRSGRGRVDVPVVHCEPTAGFNRPARIAGPGKMQSCQYHLARRLRVPIRG